MASPLSPSQTPSDTLAERLTRRPAKPMGSPRVGSNPTGVVFHRPDLLSQTPHGKRKERQQRGPPHSKRKERRRSDLNQISIERAEIRIWGVRAERRRAVPHCAQVLLPRASPERGRVSEISMSLETPSLIFFPLAVARPSSLTLQAHLTACPVRCAGLVCEERRISC